MSGGRGTLSPRVRVALSEPTRSSPPALRLLRRGANDALTLPATGLSAPGKASRTEGLDPRFRSPSVTVNSGRLGAGVDDVLIGRLGRARVRRSSAQSAVASITTCSAQSVSPPSAPAASSVQGFSPAIG